MRRRAARRSP
uniref:Uncharacterized protein n=1 Tax=Arundo donax TaxID=35708 RepID=A0A0A8YQN3_ARUDO